MPEELPFTKGHSRSVRILSGGRYIIDGEDDVAILCTAIVIDQVLHDEKKN